MADKKCDFLVAYLFKTIWLAGTAAFIGYLFSLSSLFSVSSEFVRSVEAISWNLIPLFGGFIIAILLSDVKAAGQATPLLKLFIKSLCFCILIVLLMSGFLAASYAIEATIGSLVYGIKFLLLGSVFLLVVVSQCRKQLWRVQHAVILSLCLLGTFLQVDTLEFLILHKAGQTHLVDILWWLISMAIGLWIGFKSKQIKSTDRYDKRPDSLNRTPYVTRMTSKLCEHEGNIALIGAFGSGKTWIVDQIEKNLQETKGKWITVRIDGWGFQETAITQSIISHIIKDVSKHVDMAAYIDLPNNYREAMKGVGSFAGALSSLVNSGLEPIQQFAQINQILETLDLKLLVTVEDVDRNSNAEALANEISSLLDQLSRYKQIRFIFSAGHDQHLYEMLMKSCGFYEYIPDSNFKDMQCSLQGFRAELLSSNPELFPRRDRDRYSEHIINCCAELFNTPRLFNRFKDKTTESWGTLNGHVCIDDLLVFNTLMYCSSTAFIELIRDNGVDNIFYHPLDNMIPPDAEVNEANNLRVKDINEETKTYKQKAEELLIAYLSHGVTDEAGRSSSPQSLQYRGNNDKQYYFRLLVQGFSASEVKDKDYLAAISVKPEELKQAEIDKITEWLLLDNTFEKLAQFVVWQHKNSSAVVVDWLMLLVKLYPKDQPFEQDLLNRINSVYHVLEDNFGYREPQVNADMLNALIALGSAYFIAFFLICGERSTLKKARAIAEDVDFKGIANKLNGKIGRWNDEYDGWYTKDQVVENTARFEAYLSDDYDKHLREKFTMFKKSLDVAPNPVEVEVDPV